MLPIAQFLPHDAAQLVGVLTDIDDTLTTGGKLLAAAYAALWRLRDAGLRVLVVSGRPAGWCDAIARQWPVDGVVGENGAFAFYEADGRLQRLFHPAAQAGDLQHRLAQVRHAVLREVPGSRVAKDQAYRLYDLAIDFCEEAPDLGLAAAERIRAVFARHGAQAKVSSIHVNGWFGDYDKLTMTQLFARHVWDMDLAAVRERFVFCGDSPNDAPMFAYFPHACGVANVAAFAAHLCPPPRYVSVAPGGLGFAEIVDVLLARRAGS